MKRKHTQRGFTLMELMVVIIIVAILAAVAVPLYINYVRDARRTEAKGAIAAIISAEQVYYQEFGGYTDDPSLLKVDLSDVAGNWGAPTLAVAGESFTVTLVGAGAAAGLEVCCVYTKGANPQWGDEATPCN